MRNQLLAVFIVFICFSCKQAKKEKIHEKDIRRIETSSEEISKRNAEIESKKIAAGLSFAVEGTYRVKDPSCEISLQIDKKEGRFNYKLKTGKRQLSGPVAFEKAENADGHFVYIILKNIEWAEYEGELDENGAPVHKDLPLPKNVEGMLDKDGIIIQNEGNSMNQYVKIDECGLKYIHLKKG